MRSAVFITHPNVLVDCEIPVPQWPLSPVGLSRMRAALRQPWVPGITAVYCSTEQKAIDGASILAAHLGLRYQAIEELGENDRSSTGFLPPDEFERVADEFFARPAASVRGWETACAAQERICRAVEQLVRQDGSCGTIAVVSHGAVGALLYCRLAGVPISRRWDQPATGGGNFYHFQIDPPRVSTEWRPIDG